MALDVSVGNEAGGEAEESVDVVASLPSDAVAPELVEPGHGALDDPAVIPEAGSVRQSTTGDCGFDVLRPNQAAIPVVVVGAVAEQNGRPLARTPDETRHRGNLPEQGHQLGHVVMVFAGQRHGERGSLPVDKDVVLAAWPDAVDRARPACGPRRAARTWLESITARDQSSYFAARSLASTTCSRSHTPASFHAARRRQQVIPYPKPSSCGRYSHWIPVCSTDRIPRNACPRGTRGRLMTSFGLGFSNNGSTGNHSSSETIYGRGSFFPTNRPTSLQADSHTRRGFCHDL